MNCPKCQALNPDGALFCGECGAKLEAVVSQAVEESVVTSETAEATVQTSDAAEATVPTPDVAEATVPTPVATGNAMPVAQPVAEKVTKKKEKKAKKKKEKKSELPVTKKKKSKLPVIIVVILLIAALGTAGVVYGKDLVMSLFKSPEERLVDGFFKSMEARSGEIYTVIEIEDIVIESDDPEQDNLMGDILKGLEVEATVRYDQKEKLVGGELGVRVKGTSLLSADYYITEDYVIVDAPLLYDDPMYWDIYAVIESIRDGINDGSFESSLNMFNVPTIDQEIPIDEDIEIDFELLKENHEEYVEFLDRDTFKSYDEIEFIPYKDIMIPVYEDSIDSIEGDKYEMEFDSDVEYKADRYEIDFDYDDYSDMTDELVEIFADDDKVKDFIEEILTLFVERVIETEDYAMFALLAEESIDDIDEWDDDYEDDLMDIQDDLLDRIDDRIGDMEDSIEESKEDANESSDMDLEEVMSNMNVSMTLDLDDKGYLRSQIIEMDGVIEDNEDVGDVELALTVITEFNLLDEEVDIESIDEDDAIDVGDMNEEELESFQDEVQNNVLESLKNNPVFSEMIPAGF